MSLTYYAINKFDFCQKLCAKSRNILTVFDIEGRQNVALRKSQILHLMVQIMAIAVAPKKVNDDS